jgi:hypothetical protein
MFSRISTYISVVALAFPVGCQSSPTDVASPSPAATASPASTPVASVVYAGGDGSTLEKAVIVQTNTEKVGIRAEYAWLAQRYPGSKRISQALFHKDGKSYDLLTIQTKNGKEVKTYFDISSFFGKY